MTKRTLIYIEDLFDDIESLTNIIDNEYNIYPSNKAENDILLANIKAYLGHNKDITIKQGELFIDNIMSKKNISGYIIDYKLAGESEDKDLTGINFFDKYVIKSTRDKFNCLFSTSFKSHTKHYRNVNDFIAHKDCEYTNGSIKLLNKIGLNDIDEEEVLVKTLKKLFPTLPKLEY